jgi:RNA polymerase sigma-70 factor, ECF subfamily
VNRWGPAPSKWDNTINATLENRSPDAERNDGPHDSTWIERAKSGDRDAFRKLYEAYHRRLYAMALSVVKNPEDALDIVQEAFVKAHKNLPKFEGTSGFYTWIYRIAMNAAIDHVRKNKRAAQLEWEEGRGDHEQAASDLSTSAPSNPLAGVERAQLRRAIEAALDELPEYHRVVILMRDVEGFSYEEMATTLAVPKGTIMSRLFHARRKMQAALEIHLDTTTTNEVKP